MKGNDYGKKGERESRMGK